MTNVPANPSPDPPAQFKNLEWLLFKIVAKRQILTDPFVVGFAIVVALGGYFFGESGGSAALAIKNERISFLNDQIAAYKDRLQGATPDQAAKQVKDLQAALIDAEDRLNAIDPTMYRHLSEEQNHLLGVNASSLVPFGLLPIFSPYQGDSFSLATEIVNALDDAHVSAIGPLVWYCLPQQRGINVALKDPNHPTAQASALVKILSDAKISFATAQATGKMGPEAPDVSILVCRS